MKQLGVLFIIAASVLILGCGQKDTKELKFVEGVVFEDANDNSTRDDGEKGISGVLVSNQYNVVKTNRKGRYRIPLHGENATIFVIKPAAYNLPGDDNMNPRFFYVHRFGDRDTPGCAADFTCTAFFCLRIRLF